MSDALQLNNGKKGMTIVISSDGRVTIEVKGVAGPSCLELTKFLERSLGQVAERRFTSEYYQTNIVNNSTKITKW